MKPSKNVIQLELRKLFYILEKLKVEDEIKLQFVLEKLDEIINEI